MPRSRIRALAAVLLSAFVLAGCAGDDASGDAEAAAPTGDADVTVVGTDTLQWDTETLEADAGEITVELVCEEAVNHNFVIDETDEEVVECAPGETAQGTVELEPGEYTYVCTVPGHESSMRGTLTVE